MIDILARYIEIFLHPFTVHRNMRLQRLGHYVNGQKNGIELAEAISISWIWYMIQDFFVLLTISMTSHLYDSIETESVIASMIVDSWQRATMRVTVLTVLVGVVFFPVYEYIFFRLYTVVIRFYSELFKLDTTQDAIEQTVQFSMVGNTFLVLPIIGRMLSFFSTCVYLFAGLRNNMGMTNLQSTITMVTPLFALMLFVGLFFTLMIMAIGVIA